MCGIVGFNWRDDSEIRRLVGRIRHRGPDGQGFFSDARVTLGHCRLAVLDPGDAGHQPMMYHPDAGGFSEAFPSGLDVEPHAAIVYNGELFNYPEIRRELQGRGYRFTTRCDTECILAAYLEWGQSCVTRFNGMWSFCIYDLRKGVLFLSRDRLGVKPLFYREKEGQFIFASELKSVLWKGSEREVDPTALLHYKLFGYTPVTHSIFKGVLKLPPATNLQFDLKSGKMEQEKFWSPVFREEPIEEDVAVRQVRLLLRDAVEKRLLADVPVGAFLSGGLDSSIVCALMRPRVERLKTFSIRFDVPGYDESEPARAVAHHLETEHHEVAFGAGDVRRLMEELPVYFDEPFADASMVPMYLVASVAAREVKVCLSGTGADELFAGYRRYREYLLLRRLSILPDWVKRGGWFWKLRDADKGAKLTHLLLHTEPGDLYLKLFSPLFRGEEGTGADLRNLSSELFSARPAGGLNDILGFDQSSYLPGDLLVKEDRATMAHHLEGRVPFLDYRVAEFANRLPLSMKLRRNGGKYLLKRAFSDLLPSFVPKRKKQGFGVPLKHYFCGELRDMAREMLLDPSGENLWDRRELERLWKRHQEDGVDYSPLFWNVIMYRQWCRTYLTSDLERER